MRIRAVKARAAIELLKAESDHLKKESGEIQQGEDENHVN